MRIKHKETQKLRICILGISKKINLILNFIKDGALTNQEIVEKAEEIRSEISQANELDHNFPLIKRIIIKPRKV